MRSPRPTIVDANDPAALPQAVARLRAGGLVAFPTETVYGLGANAHDPAAVKRIYDLKGRPSSHPLIVHLADGSHLKSWALEPSHEALLLAEAFWPGPLTLVLRRSSSVPGVVTGGQETVALRVPAHPVAAALLAAFGSGLAAPSANLFGRVSPTSAAHVAAEFPTTDLLILDGGACEVGVESTIVDLSATTSGSAPRLLRPGGVAAADIEVLLGRRLIRPRGTVAGAPGAADGAPDDVALPRVPGSRASHYAARAPSRLVAGSELAATALATLGSAVLARHPAPISFEGRWLQLPDEPVAYARALYSALRELDATSPRQILIEGAPGGDAWLAVRDRLSRATAGDSTEPVEALVAVVMGSSSDWETMRHASEVLEELAVEHACLVVSAHRTPERMAVFGKDAAERGFEVVIAGAGGAAHLPGMLAAHTHLPVLGVPVESRALQGVDSLLSIVQMPRGVPVGTLAIGSAGAANAALLAVSILAINRPDLRQRLISYREAMAAASEASTLPSSSFRSW